MMRVRPLGSTLTVVRFSKLARSCAGAPEHKAIPSITVAATKLRTRTELPPGDYSRKTYYTGAGIGSSHSTERFENSCGFKQKNSRSALCNLALREVGRFI